MCRRFGHRIGRAIGRYAENRNAFETDRHPTRRETLIHTQFGNTYQAHIVKTPEGAWQQLMFFGEPSVGER